MSDVPEPDKVEADTTTDDVDEVSTPTKPIPIQDQPAPPKLTAAERRVQEIADGTYHAMKRLEEEREAARMIKEFEEEQAAREAALLQNDDISVDIPPQDPGQILYKTRPHWMSVVGFGKSIVIGPIVFAAVLWVWFALLRDYFSEKVPNLVQADGIAIAVAFVLPILLTVYLLVGAPGLKDKEGNSYPSGVESLITWIKERRIVTENLIVRRRRFKGPWWNWIGNFNDIDAVTWPSKVTNVRVTQDGWGKVFNYGTVTIDTYGDDDVYFVDIPFVRRPYELKKLIRPETDIDL